MKKVWVVIKMEVDDRTLMDYSSLVGVYDSFEKAEKMAKKTNEELEDLYTEAETPAWVEVICSELK